MPIQFTCPHCGVETNVDEQFAGHSGECAKCGKPITIPPLVGTPGYVAGSRSSMAPMAIIVVVVLGLFSVMVCSGIMFFRVRSVVRTVQMGPPPTATQAIPVTQTAVVDSPSTSPGGFSVQAPQQLDQTQRRAAERLTTRGAQPRVFGYRASWAPDSKRFVFAHRPETRGLAIHDTETGETKPLLAPGKDPAWSPGGRWIAYVCGQNQAEEIWVFDQTAMAPQRVANGGFPQWSGDGKTLYFHDREQGKLMAVTLDEDTPGFSGVSTVFETEWPYPAVSPDGKHVVLREASELVLADVKEGKTLKKWRIPAGNGLLPSWSPDGKHFGFGGYGNDQNMGLWIVTPEGEARHVASGSFSMPAWAPDGKTLTADFRVQRGWEVWTLDTKVIEEVEPIRLAEIALPPAESENSAGAETP